MVARLNAGKLIQRFVLLALIGVAPLTAATVDEARAHYGDYQAAMEAQQAAAAGGDPAAFESKGEEAARLLRAAIDAYIAAGAPASNDPALLREYTAALRARGDHDLAAEALRAAIDRGVEDAAIWRILGESLLEVAPSRYQEGIDALYHSLDLDKGSADAAGTWFALGEYYLGNQMPGEAAKAFAEALALNPEHVPAQLGDAAAKVYAGEIAAAGDIIEAVGRNAQPYDALFRAMIRGALHDFDGAGRVFEDTAVNHYAYARLLYVAARLPEALLAAHRAASLAGDRSEIWNFLGAIQIQSGDYAGARAAYETSLKVNPDQPQVVSTLEQLKKAQQEAAQQQQQAPAQAPPAQGQAPLRGQGPLR